MPHDPTYPEDSINAIEWDDGGLYEIKIKGRLGDEWREWFEGMNLVHVHNSEAGLECTMLFGVISDQSALHGLLTKIMNLNLTLISVKRLQEPNPLGSGGM
jgi:hypothetical protein